MLTLFVSSVLIEDDDLCYERIMWFMSATAWGLVFPPNFGAIVLYMCSTYETRAAFLFIITSYATFYKKDIEGAGFVIFATNMVDLWIIFSENPEMTRFELILIMIIFCMIQPCILILLNFKSGQCTSKSTREFIGLHYALRIIMLSTHVVFKKLLAFPGGSIGRWHFLCQSVIIILFYLRTVVALLVDYCIGSRGYVDDIICQST